MTKFVYKMENILGIKYKIEDQAKTNYGIARQKLNQEEEKLLEFEQKKSYYQEKTIQLMQARLKIVEIRQCQEAINIVKFYIKQQQLAVKRAEQQLEIARVRLNTAMMERKTHENLKDKARQLYLLEYDAWERKEVDELVSFKYNNSTDNQEI